MNPDTTTTTPKEATMGTAPTLFEIGEDLQVLDEMLDEALESDDHEALSVWLEELQDGLESKIDRTVAVMKVFERRAAVRKDEAQRLLDRSRVDQKKADAIKERLKLFFELHDIKSMETVHYRVTLAGNGGKQPLSLKVPVDDLPARFLRRKVEIAPDNDALRKALADGEELECAELLPRGSSIRVK